MDNPRASLNEPSNPLIRFRAVSKAYAGRPILESLDWSLMPGDCAVILGPSGSGKSVFLSLLLGFAVPDSGGVEYHPELGGDLFRHLAVVFQEDALFDDRTVEANLSMAVHERVESGIALSAADNARIRTALADVGLDPARVLHLQPQALSGGMRRRVALARALLRGPKVLVADEPTSGLDPATSRSIYDLMAGLVRSRELSMVIITHDPVCAEVLGRPVYAFTPRAGELQRMNGANSATAIQTWAGQTQEEYVRRFAHTVGGPDGVAEDEAVPKIAERAKARLFAGIASALDVVGRATLSLGIVANPPSPRLLLDALRRWGWESLPLVALIFSLLGVVLMIQAERAVTDVGFSNRLPELLVMSLTRLAPIITGFLLAGRCGSAVTAQAGWMRLSSQDKAMRAMRMDPDALLFPPLFWSFVLSAPALALAGLCAGWFAAWLILDFQLSSAQITARYFASQLVDHLNAASLAGVAAKSALIGAGIALISNAGGGSPKRSAREITAAITRGLVLCFVWITLVDVVITLALPE